MHKKSILLPIRIRKVKLSHGFKNHFDFIEVSYTKEMEEQLDAIAKSKVIYQNIASHYDSALDKQLSLFNVDTNIHSSSKESTYLCEKCGGTLCRIKSKFVFFWGCSNYKEGCKNILSDAKGKPQKKEAPATSEHNCPSCGGTFFGSPTFEEKQEGFLVGV